MRTRGGMFAVGMAVIVLAGGVVSSRRAAAVIRPVAYVDGVGLVLAHRSYHAGQAAVATVLNRTHSLILASLCLRLQRLTAGGWATVSRTHGINVSCPQTAGMVLRPGGREPIPMPLYDDLAPGSYRASLRYKPVHPRGSDLGSLKRGARSISDRFEVLRPVRGPRPKLSERQILALALRAAASDGDPRPTLVQHAYGTRFAAVHVSSGDLVFEYTWSLLIAVRGHFQIPAAAFSGPPGAKPPHGTVITLVIDTITRQATDFGISNRYPPLAQLGPVTTDRRDREARRAVASRTPAVARPEGGWGS
jgi:hypothetical protein